MTLGTIALSVFAVVMAAAAIEDFRRFVIPNLLPILLCAAWPLHFAAAHGLHGGVEAAGWAVLQSLGVALAVFLAGAMLFARGWLGGGDVKLLAVAALWAGPAGLPELLVATSLLGGAMALFLLNPWGGQLAACVRAILRGHPGEGGRGWQTPVPYGMAIAGAAVIVTLPAFFG